MAELKDAPEQVGSSSEAEDVNKIGSQIATTLVTVAEVESFLKRQFRDYPRFRARHVGRASKLAMTLLEDIETFLDQIDPYTDEPKEEPYLATVCKAIVAVKGNDDREEAWAHVCDTIINSIGNTDFRYLTITRPPLIDNLQSTMSCVCKMMENMTRLQNQGGADRMPDLRQLLGNLGRHRTYWLQAETHHLKVIKDMKILFYGYQQFQQSIIDDVNRKSKLMEHMHKVSNVWKLISAKYTHDHNRGDSVLNTGSWLYDEPGFQSWISLKFPILWLEGCPGSGKTFVASSVIHRLESDQRVGSKSSVGYCFFSTKFAEYAGFTGDLCLGLQGVACNIAETDPQFAKHILEKCKFPADIDTLHKVWRRLFVSYFRVPGRHLYLILDGLDEAGIEDRETFLRLLSDFKGTGKPRVNISVLLLARPHITQCITTSLAAHQSDYAKVQIDTKKTQGDFDIYIKQEVYHEWMYDWPVDAQRSVYNMLVSKAEGSFLWVQLVLMLLSYEGVQSDIESRLEGITTGNLREITIAVKNSCEVPSIEKYAMGIDPLLVGL